MSILIFKKTLNYQLNADRLHDKKETDRRDG